MFLYPVLDHRCHFTYAVLYLCMLQHVLMADHSTDIFVPLYVVMEPLITAVIFE